MTSMSSNRFVAEGGTDALDCLSFSEGKLRNPMLCFIM